MKPEDVSRDDFVRLLKELQHSVLDVNETPLTLMLVNSMENRINIEETTGARAFTIETVATDVIQALNVLELRVRALEKQCKGTKVSSD